MNSFTNPDNIFKELLDEPCQKCKSQNLTLQCDNCGVSVCNSKKCSLIINYNYYIVVFCSDCKKDYFVECKKKKFNLKPQQ